ncbi:MAG: anti-sigma factor RsbW [Actinomycetia bacterium]|nr:anti-sigma factor RsbW [Actinomycetes bacterium]
MSAAAEASSDLGESGVDSANGPQRIRLSIPGLPDFVRLARLAAVDAGSRLGLDYEQIEDLRIGVDELCFAVLPSSDAQPVTADLDLTFTLHPDRLEVEGSCAVGSSAAQQSELSRTIVAAVVDEFSLDLADGVHRFRLSKQRDA